MRNFPLAFLVTAIFASPVMVPAQSSSGPAPAKVSAAETEFVAGIVKLKASKFAEAEVAFRHVLELEPGGLRGYLAVAQVFMAQKKADDAFFWLRAESEKQPLRLDLHVVIGDTAMRAGRYDAALEEFQTVLSRLDPNTPSQLEVPRGAVAGTLPPGVETDPLDRSIAILTNKDQTPTGAAGIRLRLAEVYRAKGDHDSAIAAWKKVSESVGGAPWALANLAIEQEAADQKTDAIKNYRAVLAAVPGNVLVLNNLAYLLAENGGDLMEAQRYAHRAATLAPGALEVMDTEGWISLKQGYVDDALGTFKRLVLRQPGKLDYRKHLALALTQKGYHSPEVDAAIQALNAPKAEGDEKKLVDIVMAIR